MREIDREKGERNTRKPVDRLGKFHEELGEEEEEEEK